MTITGCWNTLEFFTSQPIARFFFCSTEIPCHRRSVFMEALWDYNSIQLCKNVLPHEWISSRDWGKKLSYAPIWLRFQETQIQLIVDFKPYLAICIPAGNQFISVINFVIVSKNHPGILNKQSNTGDLMLSKKRSKYSSLVPLDILEHVNLSLINIYLPHEVWKRYIIFHIALTKNCYQKSFL